MINIGRGNAGNPIGSVATLWRYPVKSMLGEPREYLDIDTRGVVGDRRYAIRNAEGKLGSGKSTRRFRRIDGLLRFRAAYNGDAAEITFPDSWVTAGDAGTRGRCAAFR